MEGESPGGPKYALMQWPVTGVKSLHSYYYISEYAQSWMWSERVTEHETYEEALAALRILKAAGHHVEERNWKEIK